MSQYARPDSNIAVSNWVSFNLQGYDDIDEETASDADYIQANPESNGYIEFGLSDVTDPSSSSDHIVRFRAWQENANHQRTLKVELLQSSTVISTYDAFNLVKGTATSYSWTLTGTEADNITDYTDLRIKFTSGGEVGSPPGWRSIVYVSWGEFEVPDGSSPQATNIVLNIISNA